MDQTIIFFFAAVLIVAGLLLAIITLTKKDDPKLDTDKYRSKWLAIEQQLKRDEISSYHLCVLNADKLLDTALRERGVKGETMGERMKNVKDSWTSPNHVWMAHKLRNQVAHESDVQVNYDDARRALMSFKQALKDMGAI